MNIRAISTDVLLGIVPIALLIVVWQGISSFGYAPVTLLPPQGCTLATGTGDATGFEPGMTVWVSR
jgi:NitT/TauT family transport system permease protein